MSTKKKYGLKDLEKKYGPLSVGKLLRAWRLSEGYSQKEFAKKMKPLGREVKATAKDAKSLAQ